MTVEDVSYAELSGETIDFGYISLKDRKPFVRFLKQNKLIKEYAKGLYCSSINFTYEVVKKHKPVRTLTTKMKIDENSRIFADDYIASIWTQI